MEFSYEERSLQGEYRIGWAIPETRWHFSLLLELFELKKNILIQIKNLSYRQL